MILLKNLKINNFLSYEDAEINFPPNAQISIEGISGSGKSSIVDAIIWALFGKGRSDNRNLIRHKAKNGSVELILLDGNTLYKIERSVSAKGKQSLNIFSSPATKGKYTPIPKTGLKDHQTWIEREFLHSSYTLFINSIAYPQENAESFVKQTASRRKDLLLEIARANDYDIYYNRAKDRAQLLLEGLIRAKTALNMNEKTVNDNLPVLDTRSIVQGQIDALEGQITIRQKQLEDLTKELNSYRSLEKEKEMQSGFINENIDTIAKLREQVRVKNEKIEKLNDIKIETIDEKIKKLDEYRGLLAKLEEIEQFNYRRQIDLNRIVMSKPAEVDYDTNIADLNKQLIGIINKQTEPCPDGKHCSCYLRSFKERAADLEVLLAAAMQGKTIYEAKMATYEQDIEKLGSEKGDGKIYAHILETKAKIAELSPYEKIKQDYESKAELISSAKKEIEAINEDINLLSLKNESRQEEIVRLTDQITMFDAPKITREIEQIRNYLSLLNGKRTESLSTLAKINFSEESIKTARAEITILKKEILKNEEELECINYAKDAFGSKGIKTIMIDYLIPRLENSINEILGQLSDFRIKLDTQRKSVDGENMIDGLFISIFNENGEEFDYQSYSGGQKMKISVAISEALASIQKVGFRLIDEAVMALDNDSAIAFTETIAKLLTKFPQILIISHIEVIKDLFSTKIMIRKQEGKSFIE